MMIEETTASSGKRRLFIGTAGLSLPANQTKANTLVASNFLYPYSFPSSDLFIFGIRNISDLRTTKAQCLQGLQVTYKFNDNSTNVFIKILQRRRNISKKEKVH